jgi:small subunit ribosomal protein S18
MTEPTYSRGEQRNHQLRRVRKKRCIFCADPDKPIDYKNVSRLRKMISDRGKILPRRTTGTCAKHQRELTREIKLAREIALLPFTAE